MTTTFDGTALQLLADPAPAVNGGNPLFVFFNKLLDFLFYWLDLYRAGHPFWALIILIIEVLIISLFFGSGGIIGGLIGRTRTRLTRNNP